MQLIQLINNVVSAFAQRLRNLHFVFSPRNTGVCILNLLVIIIIINNGTCKSTQIFNVQYNTDEIIGTVSSLVFL